MLKALSNARFVSLWREARESEVCVPRGSRKEAQARARALLASEQRLIRRQLGVPNERV